jgi:hypothetical protein
MVGGALVVAAVVAALAASHPTTLLAQADPLNQAHYRPTPVWYFDWFYQMLKDLPSHADAIGIVGLPLLIGFALIALPFLDTNPATRPSRRPFAMIGGAVATILVISMTWTGYQSASGPLAPSAPVARPSFHRDIQPLLLTSCTPCHDAAQASGDLIVDTYGQLMRQDLLIRTGPNSWTIGSPVVPGNPDQSLLIQALKGSAYDLPRMPFGRQALPKTDILTIENWIRQGANDN